MAVKKDARIHSGAKQAGGNNHPKENVQTHSIHPLSTAGFGGCL
jgi:hypothetical protein